MSVSGIRLTLIAKLERSPHIRTFRQNSRKVIARPVTSELSRIVTTLFRIPLTLSFFPASPARSSLALIAAVLLVAVERSAALLALHPSFWGGWFLVGQLRI